LVERIIEQGWDVGRAARAAGLSTSQRTDGARAADRAIGRQSSAQQPQYGTTVLPAPDRGGAGRRGARYRVAEPVVAGGISTPLRMSS
jgi:hypothetical protein